MNEKFIYILISSFFVADAFSNTQDFVTIHLYLFRLYFLLNFAIYIFINYFDEGNKHEWKTNLYSNFSIFYNWCII